MQRSTLVTLVFGWTCAALGCGGEVGVDSPTAGGRRTFLGAYDPADGVHVRVHDFVVDPSARFERLAAAEVRVDEGPRVDDLGRTIVTIRSTGRLAASLAPFGLAAEPHRLVAGATELTERIGEVALADDQACGPWPSDSQMFAPFDPVPGAFRGGVAAELAGMAVADKVVVRDVATSGQGRQIRAVRVGPLAAAAHTVKVPTVYLVATHHANEWLGEEVTLQLARWYHDSVTGAGGDPDLVALLQNVAVVFVPVVNPDGYQFTHTDSRDHRANMRDNCGNPYLNGVDLNRNYSYGWGSESDSPGAACVGQTYPGPAAASEPEVVGMQSLLAGLAFISGTSGLDQQRPAASVSLHTYAGEVIYPPVYEAAGAGDPGPPCTVLGNCLNPDFPVYRRLFGDTQPELTGSPASPMLFYANQTPYAASQQLAIRAGVVGDMTQYASHGSPGNPSNAGPHLSVTVELGDSGAAYPECEASPAAFASTYVQQQKAFLKKLVQNAPGLVSTGPYSTTYAPAALGTRTGGYLVREAGNAAGRDIARPRLVVDISNLSSASNQPGSISFNQVTVPLQMGHRGVHYQGQFVDLAALPGGPWCLPPVITVNGSGSAEPPSGIGGNGGGPCIDLTQQQRRLASSGWMFKTGLRGGVADYWWEAGTTSTIERTLVVPSYVPATQVNGMNLTACTLSFSTDWDGSSGAVYLERQIVENGATQWRVVRSWPDPASGSQAAHLRSELVETNPPFNSPPYLAAGRLNAFRFRVPPGYSPGAGFKLFEPVVLCRYGSTP